MERTGEPLRALLREKGTPYEELGLGDLTLTDERLLDAIEAHPILPNRPIVVTPQEVKRCRPSEAVLNILPAEGLEPFAKEHSEVVSDAT
ncbi:ArsC/Spx/MgsR family protein [Brevundimonas nasdae]|uniref:ArsC/Spx/MgsR family protein n=1 Tax=Brevundimonas nasdae TaxID=172043 RepID=UPI003D334EC5